MVDVLVMETDSKLYRNVAIVAQSMRVWVPWIDYDSNEFFPTIYVLLEIKSYNIVLYDRAIFFR